MKVGVIGAGRWGKNLVRTFNALGVLAAVAEGAPALRDGLTEQYPDVIVFDSHERLLASDISAVAIATPVSTHFALAKAALLAGKDVFVEKPMTETAEQATELVRISKEKGVILMVGHLLLYQPAIQFIKKFLDAGKLGRIYAYHQVRKNLGTIRTHENALYSLGVHDVAVLDYLVGQPVSSVKAVGQANLNADVEDEVTLHVTYENGEQAHLSVSWLWPFKERHLTIIGEKGVLRFDELDAKVTWYHTIGRADGTVEEGDAEVVFEGSAQPLTLEAEHFVDCVNTRVKPLSSGEQGVSVVSVLNKAS